MNIDILNANYWEHFKVAKDLALYLPINHHRRVSVEKSLNELQSMLFSADVVNIDKKN